VNEGTRDTLGEERGGGGGRRAVRTRWKEGVFRTREIHLLTRRREHLFRCGKEGGKEEVSGEPSDGLYLVRKREESYTRGRKGGEKKRSLSLEKKEINSRSINGLEELLLERGKALRPRENSFRRGANSRKNHKGGPHRILVLPVAWLKNRGS